MARPVLLILMLLAGWWWLSRLGTRSSRTSGQSASQGAAPRAPEREASQPIEQCAVCGVHAPRSGMVALPGGRYRCPEHADRGGA
ncbi:PP0621 family protein [Arthrobacter sp. NPDC080086]|uniref:PP0621 family protein n=1 Tax=Arthrobacter sp. NPDC080086 TaxID=3155917 RepID=UPI0034505D81